MMFLQILSDLMCTGGMMDQIPPLISSYVKIQHG